MNSGARGSGTLLNCFVTTPYGEEILINGEAKFPHFVVNGAQWDTHLCGVGFGPIDSTLIGDWEVHATFQSALWGFMEVRQPLNFFLYGKYYNSGSINLVIITKFKKITICVFL